MKLNLNFSFDDSEKKQSTKEKVLKAQERKKNSEESLEDAIKRIKKLKNSDADLEKLNHVFRYLLNGDIEREQSMMGKKLSKAECIRYYTQVQEKLRDEKIREMIENTPHNYKLLNRQEVFERFLQLMEAEDYVAMDTETTGLEVIYGDDILVGISITLPKRNLHAYIPLAHDKGEQLDKSYVLSRLKPLLESRKLGKVFHNYKFDGHVFRNEGIKIVNMMHDTQVAQHILNENEPSVALKTLVSKYCGVPSDTFEQLFGKDCRFNTLDLETALVYAAKDSEVTNLLYQFQMKHFARLTELYSYYQTVENPFIDVLIDMERTGFDMDMDYAKQYGKELEVEIEELRLKLVEYFGDINLNSPVQLKEALEKIVGKKLESTDAKKVLKPLKGEFKAIEVLLEYKDLVKLYSTYIDALPKKLKNDGKVHPSFGQTNTVTGRLNSSSPNFQNLGQRARKLFIAPKGKVILAGDFSQQEPRILTHFSHEPSLVEAYTQGKDFYSALAAKVFGKTYEECGDGTPERKKAKVLTLAVMYGVSAKGVAESIGISVKEAEKVIEEFYKSHKYVSKWMDEMVKFCRKNGYVNMLFGRKRRLPSINSKDKWERLRAERQTTNAIIQGSASIQTKLTMIALYEWCNRYGYDMLFSIHDEVAVLVPETISLEQIQEFEDIMVNTVKLSVPNKTDIEISYRWGEGMKVEEFIHYREEKKIC